MSKAVLYRPRYYTKRYWKILGIITEHNMFLDTLINNHNVKWKLNRGFPEDLKSLPIEDKLILKALIYQQK